jgi:peptidoglycan/xylan/chitin deacetylase (PgdA/CDA1 family)
MRPDVVARRAVALSCLPIGWLASGRGLRILMYHRVAARNGFDQLTVTPARFEQQMAYLAAHCSVLPLQQALEAPPRGAPSAVAVTFDDGYLDNLEVALPILCRHRIPATIFVTTRFCDGTQRHPRYAAEPGRLHMDWSELRTIASEEGIAIGSHTLSHPHLSRLTAEAARREIADSRTIIEQQLGRPVYCFCYPSGDFGAREVGFVRDAGYRAAVTVAPGSNRPGQHRFELRRTEITDRDNAVDLALKLRGAYDPMHAWLHLKRRRRLAAAARTVEA